MKPIIFNLFAEEYLVNMIKTHLRNAIGKIVVRQFPDEETYVKIESDVKRADVIVIAILNRPNSKILPLLFVAQTAKDLGAKHVGLIAPYLPYMRQRSGI